MTGTDLQVTVLLLAGGASRRMGRDKRLLEVDGTPLITRTYELARALGPVRVLISRPQDRQMLADLLGQDAVFELDESPGDGPLAALASTLGRIETLYALLLAVDYPLLSLSFLRRLREVARFEQPEALIPTADGRRQFACAFYQRQLAPSARRARRRGLRSLGEWIDSERIAVRLLTEQEWGGRANGPENPQVLLNWNHPRDWPKE